MKGDTPARGDFALLTESDMFVFREILGHDGVCNDPKLLAEANQDWMRKYKGRSSVLLLPRTTAQVSLILRHCNGRKLAVVPQGGNTGLVGGSVPVHDEIILGMKRMDRIISIDPIAGSVVCEAGCVLENLESAVNAEGMTMPLDLGAKGKCQIGGNVSTNAGGLRLLKYGSLHGSVLGLEVVTADGTVLDLLKTLRKDNTGYALKQLFIGAEGTLGVVTKVAILTPSVSRGVCVTLMACASFSSAVAALNRARKDLGESLLAFEFFDRAGLNLVIRVLKGASDPLPQNPAPFYVVMETAVSHNSDRKFARQQLDCFLAALEADKVIVAGTVGRNAKQSMTLWNLRERIPVALKHTGAVYKYDLSLPTGQMYELVVALRHRLALACANTSQRVSKEEFDFGLVSVIGFGHIGDGNLHLNILSPKGHNEHLQKLIEPYVYEWTAKRRGSVSAEHGVGVMKCQKLGYSKDDASIEFMRQVKSLFDPVGILNPYKVVPPRVGETKDGSNIGPGVDLDAVRSKM